MSTIPFGKPGHPSYIPVHPAFHAGDSASYIQYNSAHTAQPAHSAHENNGAQHFASAFVSAIQGGNGHHAMNGGLPVRGNSAFSDKNTSYVSAPGVGFPNSVGNPTGAGVFSFGTGSELTMVGRMCKATGDGSLACGKPHSGTIYMRNGCLYKLNCATNEFRSQENFLTDYAQTGPSGGVHGPGGSGQLVTQYDIPYMGYM
jgi:hypothetical protein